MSEPVLSIQNLSVDYVGAEADFHAVKNVSFDIGPGEFSGKMTRGVFVYVRYVGLNNLVPEIERNLRLIDDVVRYQTVQIKERVHVEDYQVDPADTQFHRLEQAPAEEEEEVELAARLGLVDRPRPEGHERDRGEDMEADYMDDGGPSADEAEEPS